MLDCRAQFALTVKIAPNGPLRLNNGHCTISRANCFRLGWEVQMLGRTAIALVACVAMAGGTMTPTPAEAQFRRGGGVVAGVLAGAVVGAMIAGSSRRATAAPRAQRSSRTATRSRSQSGTRQETAGSSKIDGNATMQNVSSPGAAAAGPASRDPFAKPAPSQSVGNPLPAAPAGATPAAQ